MNVDRKNIPDTVNIDNKPYSPRPILSVSSSKPFTPLQIVGHCVKCGSPIYGLVRVMKEEDINVRRSCVCFLVTSDRFSDSINCKG